MRFFSPYAGLTGLRAKTIEGEARAFSFFISQSYKETRSFP